MRYVLATLLLLLLPLSSSAVSVRGQTVNADGFTLNFTGGQTLQVKGTTVSTTLTVQVLVNGQTNAQTCVGTTGPCTQTFSPLPSTATVEAQRANIQARVDATGLGVGWDWRVCSVNPLHVNIITYAGVTSPGVPVC